MSGGRSFLYELIIFYFFFHSQLAPLDVAKVVPAKNIFLGNDSEMASYEYPELD